MALMAPMGTVEAVALMAPMGTVEAVEAAEAVEGMSHSTKEMQ